MPIRITGLNSGLDTESIISALVSSYSYKTDKYKKAQTKLSWKQDAWKELNTKIYSLYKNVGNLKMSSAYNLRKTTVSDTTKAVVTAGSGVANGSYSVQVTQLAKAGYLTGAKLKNTLDESAKLTKNSTLSDLGYSDNGSFSITVGGKEKTISVNGDTKIGDVLTQLNEAGVNASFDEKNQRIFISAKEAGEANDFELGGTVEILSVLGINAVEDSSGLTDEERSTKAIKEKAQGSIIYVNGAKFEGDTNTVTVNGLSIQATGVTGDAYDPTGSNAFNVTVSTDTEGIYDKIKDFLSQYNSLVNEMTRLYNADSAKGYEPLTDEEKDAMSDTEVEKWEEKIKASLLRRDDTLSGVLSAMTGAMSKSYEVNGKTYSLSSFGIQTLGFLNAPKNEHNAYHIDGDEDDANTSGKTDKLMAALNEDPDAVIGFMKELTTGLYNAVDKKMKSTTLSSVYTVYNDKEMASEYSDYTSLIAKWEDRLEQQQEYYYDKFAQMETALSKLNSQTSSLSGLFGM